MSTFKRASLYTKGMEESRIILIVSLIFVPIRISSSPKISHDFSQDKKIWKQVGNEKEKSSER